MTGNTLARSLARSIVVLFLATVVVVPASAGSFTNELWDANRDLYQQILQHPFLQGMVSGSLDRRTFARYLVQDAYYLREFAVALRVAAAHAPKKAWTALLEQHAQDSLNEEMQLHRSVLAEYGVSAEEMARMEPPPDAFAYTTYILAMAHGASFGEAMSALLPCYWIYREVGRDLKKQGTPEPTYRQWIDAYASPEYNRSVDAVLAIVNDMAAQADDAERARMRDRFRRGFQYEWLFWEAAYNPRAWPGAVNPRTSEPQNPRTAEPHFPDPTGKSLFQISRAMRHVPSAPRWRMVTNLTVSNTGDPKAGAKRSSATPLS